MSVFSETMIKAISDYRFLLRRYLQQAERMAKLRELKLRDSDIYDNDLALFHVGKAIIEDMKNNMDSGGQGYYAYSGIGEFCKFLGEYLDNYFIENDHVVHRAQKAARAIITAAQLMALSRDRLDEVVAKKLFDCNRTVVNFGSQEQCELQLHTLTRQQASHPGFYTRIIADLKSLILSDRSSVAA